MSELENLKRFHGHLGPYAVIGLRIGKIAVEKYVNNFMYSLQEDKKK